jgi:archaemetzincin
MFGRSSAAGPDHPAKDFPPPPPPGAAAAPAASGSPAEPSAAEDRERAERLRAVMEKLRPLAKKISKPGPSDWLAQHKEPGQTFKEYLACDPTRPTGKRNTIYIQPLGDFTETQRKIVKLTADFMAIYFNVPVKVKEDLALKLIPAKARRKHPTWGMDQILTGYVLDEVLVPRLPEDAAACIAFTASDLWPGQGWNFVFGQASLEERVGVWSIYRNGDPEGSAEDFRLCLLRTLKTATHETGHMFSLFHCTLYECNMCGSNHREESDRRPITLCPECLAKTCWATRTDPIARYKKLIEFCKAQELKPEVEMYEKLLAAIEEKPAAAPGGPGEQKWKQGQVVEVTGKIHPSKADVKYFIEGDDGSNAHLKSEAISKLKVETKVWVKGAVEYVRHEAPPDYDPKKYGVRLPLTFCYIQVTEFKVLDEPRQ